MDNALVASSVIQKTHHTLGNALIKKLRGLLAAPVLKTYSVDSSSYSETESVSFQIDARTIVNIQIRTEK